MSISPWFRCVVTGGAVQVPELEHILIPAKKKRKKDVH